MRLPGQFTAVVLALVCNLTPAYAEDVTTQRSLFLAAEKALQYGQTGIYQQLKGQLEDYPLYIYLEYQELTRKLSHLNSKQVREFIDKYPDAVLADRLRDTWLNKLSKQQRWDEYLSFYEKDWSTIRHCHYLTALVKTGKVDQTVYTEIETMWLYPKSRPKACDPAFKALENANRITPELAWQRISLAMNKGQTQLATYLARWLPVEDRIWVDRWVGVHRFPNSVLDKSKFSKAHPYRETILSHGIKRKARTNALQAVADWKKLQTRYQFSPLTEMLTERQLALSMLRNKDLDAYKYLADFAACSHDTYIQETRLRAALIKQDWSNIQRWVDELPPELADSERWRYWKARALGEMDQKQAANELFTSLADSRSYYGFLAADQVGKEYSVDNRETPVSDKATRDVLKIPAVTRAHELVALNRLLEARREWYQTIADMPRSQLMAVAKLAQSWLWHDQAIFTLARTGYWEDLSLRFPLEHGNQVSAAATRTGLDINWIYAVIRQESAFNPTVRSSAGAIGLMQLMPATAKQVSVKMLKQSAPSTQQLKQPKLNIRLGSTYLHHVFNKLDNNPVLATAAYNAGPHRVQRWLPAQSMAADIWVELIPFKETQNYVKRVMEYSVIYNKLLDTKKTRLAKRMPVIAGTDSKTAQMASKAVPKS